MHTKKDTKVMGLLILFSFLAKLSQAGTIDPLISDSKYLAYAEDFKYVGKLEGYSKNGSKFKASAVAIDHHHILTAAHIIYDSKHRSCVFSVDGKKFDIITFKKPKEFDIQKFGHYDIALGYSEKSFELKFYPQLYENDDEIGKVCCIAGYGSTGTFVTGAITRDGQLRAGSNVVDDIYKDLLICSPSNEYSSTRTSLEFLISTGDSGGGLFINEKLAGINSCVLTNDDAPNSSYNDKGGHTRVSRFIEWIEKNKTE